MANDAVLGLIGLAKRASKLVIGDELVFELCALGKARCILLANDTGANAEKRAERYAEKANIPLISLPYNKATLGGALGRGECAVCAISDIGIAAALAEKLKGKDETYSEIAEKLSAKNERIQSRKGKKKQKTAEGKPPISGSDKKTQTKHTTEVSANGNRK